MSQNNIYTVEQVNKYVRNMFAQDYFLRRIYVRGEVSNCKYHTSGHIYFSLKDESGTIACVMFAGARRGLAFRMKDGDRVIVGGSVEVYTRDSKYQLYAKEITLEGSGLLYERFLALNQELEEMGMFSQEYKKPIPGFVKRLGVVTAPTGAAVQDIRNVALRRNPYLQIIIWPALVQGEGAAESIARGIRALDRLGLDVIIAGRGGGSIEDLWAFNEEIVARAIFECETPVISAVGHETDFTIADFVADMRAPTPSAAAELAVNDFSKTIMRFRQVEGRMMQAMHGKTAMARQRLYLYQEKLRSRSPESRLREDTQRLADLENRLQDGMHTKITEGRHRLMILAEKFTGLSPLHRLKSGYSYVASADGKAVTSIESIHTGDMVTVHVTDGRYEAVAKDIIPGFAERN